MPKMNLLFHLNAYEDEQVVNSPSLNNFKWSRDMQQITISEPESKSLMVSPSYSTTLFSGSVSISADNSTTWKINPHPTWAGAYVIGSDGGAAPNFRTLRTMGADATTEITVTKNAKLLTFTASGGTIFDLVSGGVSVGDEVIIGNGFNLANQNIYKVLNFNATSLVVENEVGVSEGPIVLGSDFANNFRVFSQDGVQKGDKIDIQDGFSSVTFGTYEIIGVSDSELIVFSNSSLPVETSVSNDPDAFIIYRNAKQFIFIESLEKIKVIINGNSEHILTPMYAGTTKLPGMLILSSTIKSIDITNLSQSTAHIYTITVE